MKHVETYLAVRGRYYWHLALDASRHGDAAAAVAYRHLALGDDVESSLAAASVRLGAERLTGR